MRGQTIVHPVKSSVGTKEVVAGREPSREDCLCGDERYCSMLIARRGLKELWGCPSVD